jgi:putative solute:sodium symporter small subunit
MKKDLKQYWKRNLKYLTVLLTIWFVASYGLGIIFADEMNAYRMGGFKLGFWFAQQGSIYAFIGIIFAYVYYMNKLDKDFDVDEKEEKPAVKTSIKSQPEEVAEGNQKVEKIA